MSSFHHPVPSPISVAAAEEEGAAHLLRTLEAAVVGQTYGSMDWLYRGELKGLYVLLSRTHQGQAEQLRKSKKKILPTTYKPFS